jgi:hypothetical protein
MPPSRPEQEPALPIARDRALEEQRGLGKLVRFLDFELDRIVVGSEYILDGASCMVSSLWAKVRYYVIIS